MFGQSVHARYLHISFFLLIFPKFAYFSNETSSPTSCTDTVPVEDHGIYVWFGE
jgi:hypothetical protein